MSEGVKLGGMEDDNINILPYFVVGLVVFSIIYILRKYFKGTSFNEKISAHNYVAIVTGANSGIGFELVRELNLRYVKVYMLCRDVEKGRDAARKLCKRYGCNPSRLIVKKADLCDFSSIRKFVEEFNREENKLDILINNAAIMMAPRYEKTVDGNEVTLQANYLGHFYLTELLLEKLEKSEFGGRIVNVSALLHMKADTADLEVCNSQRKWSHFIMPYNRTKLANVMHAVALTKRIRDRDSSSKITINSCHPGVVNTNLIRHPIFTGVLKPILKPLIWFFFKTPNDGAQTPLFLALSKKVKGVSGQYFSDCARAPHHALADAMDACDNLYNESLALCHIEKSRY